MQVTSRRYLARGGAAAIMIALIVVALLLGFSSQAQASTMLRMSQDQLQQASSDVMAAEVVGMDARMSFTGYIDTIVKFKVLGVLKGSATSGQLIEVAVPGGTVGDVTMVAEGQPSFRIGEAAKLFVDSSRRIIGGAQGKVELTLTERALYGASQADWLMEGETASTLEPSVSAATPSITTITPSSGSAGTNTSVTISGSGFGSVQGSVSFTYQSGSTIAAAVTSWSDTTIICTVPIGTISGYPAAAGSGPVTVTNSSSQSTTVNFAVTFAYGQTKWNVSSVSFRVNPNSSDTTEEQALLDAGAGEWNGAGAQFAFVDAGVDTNFTSYTSSANGIFWGNGLAVGILAQAAYWYSGSSILACNVQFNDYYAWGTGAAGTNTYDIQGITAHELGHWLNLRDLYGADSSKVMYGYGGMNQEKRTLDAGDIAGIRWIYGSATTTTYTLATSVASGSGSITRNPDQASYNSGSTVTLTATPANGYTFTGWGGNASGTTTPLTVTMDANKTITASFTLSSPVATRYEQSNPYLVYAGTWSTTSSPSYSGSSYKYTNVTGGKVTATFTGTSVSYIAKKTSNVGIAKITLDGNVSYADLYSSGTQYKQAVWSATGLGSGIHTLVIERAGTGNGSSTGFTINLDALDIVGVLTTPGPTSYTLATSVASGSGSITRNPDQASYNSGSTVTLTATPANGYIFTGWGGNASGTTNPLTVTMDANKTITASFTLIGPTTYTLATSVASGSGSITRNPDQASYNSGSTVTLTATPANGYTFTGWGGNASGTTTPLTVTMDANKTITASFTLIGPTTYTLATSVASGSGSITRNPDQASYNSGSTVTLTATPANGYTFTGWGGNASGTTTPLTVTMDANKTITASFTLSSPVATRYEQSNPYLVYAGTWSTTSSPSYSGSSYKYTNVTGGKVTATFTGTSVSYIAKKTSNVGIAKITLDGNVSYADLYSSGTQYKQAVWSATGLGSGIHTLVIEYSGLRNPSSRGYTVNLDALDITGILTSR